MHIVRVNHFNEQQREELGVKEEVFVQTNSDDLKEDVARLSKNLKGNVPAILEAFLLLSSKHLQTFTEFYNTSELEDLPKDILEKLKDMSLEDWETVGLTKPKKTAVETTIFVLDNNALEEFRNSPDPVES